MIEVKAGVIFKELKPQIYILFPLLDSIFDYYNRICVITSAADGKHMKLSKHYQGLALDLRSRDFSNDQMKLSVLQKLRDGAGPKYDVLLEHLGNPNEHFHLEFDPKD